MLVFDCRLIVLFMGFIYFVFKSGERGERD